MKGTLGFIFCLLLCSLLQGQDDHYVSVKRNLKLMGSDFEITVVAFNEEIGYINIEEAASEIKRIEKLISSRDPDSETSRINANAGIQPVKVSPEVFNLIKRSVQISELTSGAFDISYASLDDLWHFDGSLITLPTRSEIGDALSRTGYRNIILNEPEFTVFLKNKGMRIAFGAIGKGYAADKAKALLVSKQVPAGMINAAGDITSWGTKATGEKWLIGVANPVGTGNLITWVPLVESSVGISGNRLKYITIKDIRHTDIIDPRTGYPVSGISKVTVFGKMAELCDALATAVFILGKDEGLAMINQLGGTEAIVEDDQGMIYPSNGLMLQMN